MASLMGECSELPVQSLEHHHEVDIELLNHCAFCLRQFIFSTEGDETNQALQKETSCVYVPNPKLASFEHLWAYLGMNDSCDAGSPGDLYRFVKEESLPDGNTIRVSSLVPPLCRRCYANVLILNDFHVQLMKVKSRLMAQAKEIHDIIIEAGNINQNDETYTGRLKEFYENSSSAGMMLAAMLRTMDFLSKLRSSQLFPENDPLKTNDDSIIQNFSPLFENEGSDGDREDEEDVKPDVSDVPFTTIQKQSENPSRKPVEGKPHSFNSIDATDILRTTIETEKRGGIKTRALRRQSRRPRKFSSEDDDWDNDYYSPSSKGESSSESSSDQEESSDSEYGEPKRKRAKRSTCRKSAVTNLPILPSKRNSSIIKHYSTPSTTGKKAWPRSQLCEVCNKRIRVGVMLEHLKSHIQDYCFPCPNTKCGLCYISPLRVRLHLKSVPECQREAKMTSEDVSILKCNSCEYESMNLAAFKLHLDSHEKEHEVKNIPCPFKNCSLSFGVKQSVEMHLSVHVYRKNPNFKKKIKCNLCPKYVEVLDLEQHYKDIHDISELFKCQQCPYIFHVWSDLIHHKNVHKKRGDGVMCDQCPEDQRQQQNFEDIASLVAHYSKVHGIGGFGCPTCKKLYSTKYRLQYHLRDGNCKEVPEENSPEEQKHLKGDIELEKQIKQKESNGKIKLDNDFTELTEEPEKWKFGFEVSQICEICNKRKRRTEMVDHLRTHVKEYVYFCQGCNLAYITPFKLRLHLKSSLECMKACNLSLSEVMTLKCNSCDYKTERTFAFKRHVNTHEREIATKTFACPFAPSCSKLFALEQSIPFHLSSHTFYKENNVVGNSSETEKSDLNKPLPLNKLKLEDIKGAISSNSQVEGGKWKFGREKSQMCEVCNKRKRRSEMIAHLKTHVKDYIFTCPNKSCVLCYISPFRRIKHLKQSPECLEACNLNLKQITTMQCETCDHVTNNLQGFKNHVQKHEKLEALKPIECPIDSCLEKFAFRQSVEIHMTSHVFRSIPSMKIKQNCMICKRAFNLTVFESHLKKVHKVEEILKCGQCPFVFDNAKRLVLHKKVHSKRGEVIKCELCLEENGTESSFEKFKEYLRHCDSFHEVKTKLLGPTSSTKTSDTTGESSQEGINTEKDQASIHKKPKIFKCEMCQPNIEFQSEERFLTHNVRYHGSDPYICRVCKKSFNSRATRNRHVTEVHNPNSKKNKKAYCCEFCGNRYASPSTLSAHRRSAHLLQRFYCDQCGKQFVQKNKLQRHIETVHLGIKRHECPTCGLKLTSPHGLKMHKMTHTGEKPYLCDFLNCGKSFTQSASLYTHKKTHYKNQGLQPILEKDEINDGNF